MKINYDTSLNIIEEYVQSIGYANLDSFNDYHNITDEENRCAVEAVTNYLVINGLLKRMNIQQKHHKP